MKSNKKYWSAANLYKKNPNFNIAIVYGQKSNGKSYDIKKRCIQDALDGKGKMIYMRRYDMDVKTRDVEAYFADAPISEMTHDKFNGVIVKSRYIYLAKYEEGEKAQEGPLIGRAVYLAGYEHNASQNFGKVANVVFEEVMTVGAYYPDEPNLLLKFLSTILRDNNEDAKVWLIGNTVNRIFPYTYGWSLTNLLKQKQGTIDEYRYTRYDEATETEVETIILCEYCESAGSQSKFTFGKSAEMIAGGMWETKEVPKLPRSIDNYFMVYEVLLSEMGFSFVLQLLVNKENGGQIVYVYPYTKTRNIRRKITRVFSDDPFTSVNFYDNIEGEITMHKLIANKKVCFSDNQTGTDFAQILLNRGGI